MFPEPTELLLICCLIESVWTPRPQIKCTNTKNQLADILTNGKLTWWMESSFVFVQHEPCQFHQQAQSDVEKSTRRYRWRKSHGKIKANDEFGIKMNRDASSTTSENLGDTKSESQNVPLSPWNESRQEQGDLWWALAHQTTQNGTMTTSGVLKCGNLVKCWEEVRRDPLMTSLS